MTVTVFSVLLIFFCPCISTKKNIYFNLGPGLLENTQFKLVGYSVDGCSDCFTASLVYADYGSWKMYMSKLASAQTEKMFSSMKMETCYGIKQHNQMQAIPTPTQKILN